MFKPFRTLVRGALAQTGDHVIDRGALVMLDQQMRDAVGEFGRSRRALALAVAHDRAEERRLESTGARLRDLETGAVLALRAGRDDLAGKAAEAIAEHETERDALCQAREVFEREIAAMRGAVAEAGRRLAELDRGRRIAAATGAVRRLRTGGGPPGHNSTGSLAEAEATLRRLRETQARAADYDDALAGADAFTAIQAALGASGFAEQPRPAADRVLERLKMRALAAPEALTANPR